MVQADNNKLITWDNFLETANEMRRKGKVDGNQTKVVEALRKAGLSVAITSSLGNGFPDLVVSKSMGVYTWSHSRTILIELKDPAQPPSKRALTDAEQKFCNEWRGEIYVCTTAEEILRIFGLI